MSNDSKSFEKKLDRDFLQYLSLTKRLFDNIKSDNEKTLCEAWLNQLCGKSIVTLSGKRNRNIYLSRLLLQMQDGKLKDIFLSAPPTESLESPYTVFGLPLEVEDVMGFKKMGFQLDADVAGGSGDYSEFSRDGRTYLATRQITNGMMAYLAVTITEDEPLWLPQQTRETKFDGEKDDAAESRASSGGRFVKKLAQFECVPLTQLRKSPQERDSVLEWMDKIIEDCNKWLRGEDPHNMDLETLFELLHDYYKDDEEKAKILEYSKDVRDIIMRDIREKITERRAEVSKRELILDQFEADEYVEERLPGEEEVDGFWLQCAERPMKAPIKWSLDQTYPAEVVNRFFMLLIQERISIIEKGEKDAKKKLSEMKNSNVDDIKAELYRVKKLREEYKEYYCIYEKVEEYEKEYERIVEKSSVTKGGRTVKKQEMAKLKEELEEEIEGYRNRYEIERKNQGELVEKLEEAKETLSGLKEAMKINEERLKCDKENLLLEKERLQETIMGQKKRLCELKKQVNAGQLNGVCHCED